MTFTEIHHLLLERFGTQKVTGIDEGATPKAIFVAQEAIAEVMQFLYASEGLYFDMLSCLTGMDNGTEAASMEVIYNLYSIPYQQALMVKVVLAREKPEIDSMVTIWKTADWHEREAFDLLGIHFKGHPDMRRILMPADWEGHPLRKDYSLQAQYHGIEVKY